MDSINRIQFQIPALDRLRRRYTVVDLHFHSCHSDGVDSVDQIAKHARQLNIGVAITDHNCIDGAVALDKYADVLSIPGIEITSREGTHVLVYFYRIDDLKSFYADIVEPNLGATLMSSTGLTVLSILKSAKKYKGVVIFPHPYSAAFTGICNHSFSERRLHRLLKMADGVEVVNSENVKRWNRSSALLGFNLNQAITGGSDGHNIRQMGGAVTYATCEPTRRAFLDAVVHCRAKVMGSESKWMNKIQSNGVKFKKSINNYPDLVEKNIRYGKSVIRFRSRRATEWFWKGVTDKHMQKAFYCLGGIAALKINYNALPLFIFSLFS